MSHAWNQTILVNETLAKDLIESQCTLKVKNIIEFGSGWDNVAYLINDEFIFRFPRREMALSCMQNEIYFLPYLAHHISFPFSCPVYIGKPSENYAYPFAGYRYFKGKAMIDFHPDQINRIDIAEKLARWLRELHQVPILEVHRSQFAENIDWRLDIKHNIQKHSRNLIQYSKYFQAAGFEVSSLQKYVNDFNQFDFSKIKNTCYLHGDLYFKHIIFDEKLKLKGLIDWGDIHIGLPGIDLSVAITSFDGEVRKKFFETYQNINQELLTIAAFRAFCHQISLLPYAYEQNDRQCVLWSAIALRRAMNALFIN